jgi:hypothetical protein
MDLVAILVLQALAAVQIGSSQSERICRSSLAAFSAS